MQQIYQIWSHQIESNIEKICLWKRLTRNEVFVRGSKRRQTKRFSEVYWQNPDIDSTALMISTSSWLLDRLSRDRQSLSESPISTQTTVASKHSSDYIWTLLSKVGITNPQRIAEFEVDIATSP